MQANELHVPSFSFRQTNIAACSTSDATPASLDMEALVDHCSATADQHETVASGDFMELASSEPVLDVDGAPIPEECMHSTSLPTEDDEHTSKRTRPSRNLSLSPVADLEMK